MHTGGMLHNPTYRDGKKVGDTEHLCLRLSLSILLYATRKFCLQEQTFVMELQAFAQKDLHKAPEEVVSLGVPRIRTSRDLAAQ